MKFIVYELVSETIRGLKFYFEKNRIEPHLKGLDEGFATV